MAFAAGISLPHFGAATPTVTVSGGGGGTPPIISWTPGDSNDALTIGMAVSNPSNAITILQTMGMRLTNPSNAIAFNPQTTGMHLSGTALGAPFWQSVQTQTGSGDLVITKPTGIVSGDLMVALLGSTVTGPSATPDWTAPAGWTGIRGDLVNGAANSTRARSFYRIADGTEGATFTFTFAAGSGTVARNSGEIHRIIGTHTTTPINVSNGGTLLGTALTPDPVNVSVTTTVVNCLVLAWLVHDHLALTQTHTAPASHTEVSDFESTNAANTESSTTDWRAFAAIGATGTATHDCTETVATDACYQRIAIQPGTVTLAA